MEGGKFVVEVSSAAGRPATVAIIGAGHVARNQSMGFAQLAPDVRVIGVADLDEARAAQMAASCGATTFRDYHAALDLHPDIAVICLPHHLHYEAAMAALDAGCHILMEKPLAHTLEDAREIVAACRRKGVRLATSFVHRFRREFQYAHRVIDEGGIGTPAMAFDIFCTLDAVNLPEWVWHKETCGGGVLMYTGIHAIDRLRWLLNSEVEEVVARTRTYSQPPGRDVEDGLAAILTFANGCIATLVENSPGYIVSQRSWDTEVFGSTGRLRLRNGESLEFTNQSQAYRMEVARDDWWAAQAREFVSAVREGRDPWISGEDGLRAQEVVDAIYRSAKLGRPVTVEVTRD